MCVDFAMPLFSRQLSAFFNKLKRFTYLHLQFSMANSHLTFLALRIFGNLGSLKPKEFGVFIEAVSIQIIQNWFK